MGNKKSLYADLSLFIVAIIWGSGFVVTKSTLDRITPYHMLAFRFIIAALLMGIVFFKNLKKITMEDIKAGILVGVFLFGGFATQTVGLKYTTAGKQAFITATNVVMVPFIYWIISKKRPDNYDMAGAFLCLIGIGILSIEKDLTIGYGDLLTLICAVFFAFHISSVGYFAKDKDPVALSVIQIATAGVLSLIFALLFEPKMAIIQKNTVFPILYLAVFSTLLAFLIQNVAQKYTSSTHTAIILSFEAVFGSIFSLIFLKEPFTARFLIGCLAILTSVITSETKWEFLRTKNKSN
ncbi:DMT family transporter [Tissierella sp. MSJ-40]|uniref:DMT family transporter n=1 Tax=Tissierella simiarum TaxID=2841534 RepID=A0ABS6EAR0_9FIRM|nr:DMT family transporter [Tissierella simiarum]MBU5439946.1 DMT family transporter [Tissierella simiarum]